MQLAADKEHFPELRFDLRAEPAGGKRIVISNGGGHEKREVFIDKTVFGFVKFILRVYGVADVANGKLRGKMLGKPVVFHHRRAHLRIALRGFHGACELLRALDRALDVRARVFERFESKISHFAAPFRNF